MCVGNLIAPREAGAKREEYTSEECKQSLCLAMRKHLISKKAERAILPGRGVQGGQKCRMIRPSECRQCPPSPCPLSRAGVRQGKSQRLERLPQLRQSSEWLNGSPKQRRGVFDIVVGSSDEEQAADPPQTDDVESGGTTMKQVLIFRPTRGNVCGSKCFLDVAAKFRFQVP